MAEDKPRHGQRRTDASELEAATEKLFAMLHLDAGTLGSYEFPGDDVPVKAGDAVVMAPFMITKADASMGSSMEATKVTVKDSKFESKEITVKVGTTVTWMMNASFPHTVTADDGSFDSGRMGNGETFTFTFEHAGEFPYYCSLHGGPGGSGLRQQHPRPRLALIQHAAANRIGTEDGQRFYGSSFIADHRGDLLVDMGSEEESVGIAAIDLAAVRRYRASFGFFRDRRPELYSLLTAGKP